MSYIPLPTNAILRYKKIPVSSGVLLSIYTFPLTLIPALGAGKVIAPTAAMVEYNFGGTAYVAAGNFNFTQGANNIFQFGNTITLGSSIIKGSLPSSVTYTANAPLNATVTVADPTLGDGTMNIHIWYYEVTL